MSAHVWAPASRSRAGTPPGSSGSLPEWAYYDLMRLALLCLAFVCTLSAAENLKIFGRDFAVRVSSDWKVDKEDGADVLRMMQDRGPLPGPRRPIQFALTDVPGYSRATVEVDVKPLGQ